MPCSNTEEGVPHASRSGESKLKDEGTVEGEQKTGREGREENPGERKQGVQRPRVVRGHVMFMGWQEVQCDWSSSE